MHDDNLDRYDLKILAALQKDSRISNQELAEQIGLSPSPCSRRVKQLEDAGYITRQVALLDQRKLGHRIRDDWSGQAHAGSLQRF